MNKVYKRFFEELEPQQLQYIDNLITQIPSVMLGQKNGNSSNAPYSNPIHTSDDTEFFLYLENLNFIHPVAINEKSEPFPFIQYGITKYFMPYLNYYAKNLRKKS